MNTDQLNRYILHYLDYNKTQSAIMLTGAWGSGKSYYIKNELIPFLGKEENGKHQVVIVSLYGLNSTSEISKSIYLESRMHFVHPNNEKGVAGVLAAKTVAKGITSFFGIDLSAKEEDMQALYKSINLDGKLVILEDIERSGIDILEVLGYVNNLVEQDNVKVLLVANEDAIIEYEPLECAPEDESVVKLLDKLNKHKNRELSKESEKYLFVKEKTVCDTVAFACDYPNAIGQIITQFENEQLDKFSNPESISIIIRAFENHDCYNLRSFLYACQKATDIFEKIVGNFDSDFYNCVFYGLVHFSLQSKMGGQTDWDGTENFSFSLGCEDYPLFRFCYDYCTKQFFPEEKVQPAAVALKNMRLYDKRKSSGDPDIVTICNYYIYPEKDINAAIANIATRLKDVTDISFYEYGRIAVYSLILKHLLDVDIQDIPDKLVQNLEGRYSELQYETIFTTILNAEQEPKELVDEYTSLKEKMISSLKKRKDGPFGFDYKPNTVSSLYNEVCSKEGLIYTDNEFLAKFDIEKFAEVFFNCTPAQMHDYRGILLSVYRVANAKGFLSRDLESAIQLKRLIQTSGSEEKLDKVGLLHKKWLLENLTEIIMKLS